MGLESIGGIAGAALGGALGGIPGASLGASLGAGLFDSGGTKAAKAGDYRSAASGTIEGKVMGARRMGLHPLFALGTSTPGPSQVIPGQSKWGSIAKDVAAAATQIPAIKHTQASTDLLKAQAENMRAKTRELNANPAPIGAPTTGFRGWQQHLRTTRHIVPLYREVRDKDGKIIKIPNQDAGVELPETYGAYLLGREMLENAGIIQKPGKRLTRGQRKQRKKRLQEQR